MLCSRERTVCLPAIHPRNGHVCVMGAVAPASLSERNLGRPRTPAPVHPEMVDDRDLHNGCVRGNGILFPLHHCSNVGSRLNET